MPSAFHNRVRAREIHNHAGANDLNSPARSDVKLRCRLESLLKMHSEDCARCNPIEPSGPDIRKRLEELNLRMLPRSVHNTSDEEVIRAFDSERDEVAASSPASSVPQKKIS
jgi:hypothetical protein